jgi:CBS domain-containing protein
MGLPSPFNRTPATIRRLSIEAEIRGLVVKLVHMITPESSVLEAARIMVEKDVGSLVVCENQDDPVGIVTERDMLRKVTAVRADPNALNVRSIMSAPLVTAPPETSIGDAAKMMIENHVKRLVVVDEAGTLHGLITMTDIVRWVAGHEQLSDSLINYLMYNVP